MTEKCFKKCINKPGTSLDSSEQVNSFQKCFLILTCIFFIVEMCCDVHGQVHGLVELGVKGLQFKTSKRKT
jgi:hypothetical protein